MGETPLLADLFDEFPTGWKYTQDGIILSAKGVLAIKKAGCEDYTLKVNDAIISQPIHAKLNCTDKADTAVVAQPEIASQPGAVSSPATNSVEKRLRELQNLYDRGVITPEEYKATRERILSEI